MKLLSGQVMALVACACLSFVAQAEPANKAAKTGTAAAREARAEREAVAAKQAEIFARKNLSRATEAAPTTLIDVAVDETDSPGAAKK